MHWRRDVGELASGIGLDVGGPRDRASPFRRRGLPISGALLELRQLDRQRAVAAERLSAGEKGAPRLVPHAAIDERQTPFAIGRVTLRGACRPAAGDRLERIGLIQRRVHAQLETAQRRTVGLARAGRLHERQQLGHAAQHEQRALETEERRNVRWIAADSREVDGRGIGVAAGAFQFKSRPDSLTPRDSRVVSRCQEHQRGNRRPLNASAHSTGGSTRAPCVAARA